jgi:hypothetical protein
MDSSEKFLTEHAFVYGYESNIGYNKKSINYSLDLLKFICLNTTADILQIVVEDLENMFFSNNWTDNTFMT